MTDDELIRWATGPDDPFGLYGPPDSPGSRELRTALDLESATGLPQSKWNGFKLMSPHVQDAIQQFDSRFPNNVHGIVRENPQEYGQVFHDLGMDRLRPGLPTTGTESSVELPADINEPTARVNVHSHPYTGRHFSASVSLNDQLSARPNRQVEHIVQIPAPGPGEANVYLTYSGAVPPRHYTLVPNPGNLPVPPPSPDGPAPFHPMPGEGSGSGAAVE